MKQLKVLLMSLAAICAVGAVALGGANAATGTGSSTIIINNNPCTTTFDWDTGSGNPPPPTGSPATLSNFATWGCPFSIVEPPTTLTITFGSGGSATWNGTVKVNFAPGLACTYPVSSFAGAHSGTDPVNVTGVGSSNKSAGSFLCPSTVEFDIDAYLFTTT